MLKLSMSTLSVGNRKLQKK